jgi:hypothetical protein
MPVNREEHNSEESGFSLEKQRAARVMRRLFKTAEIVRCQVVYLPDSTTAQVLTPNLTYRYARKPAVANIGVGDYVSVLNPGGESSGKIWEIINVESSAAPNVFGITVDGGGSAITTGVKGYVRIPRGGTITKWSILADQSGSIQFDVWKDTFVNYPPTIADTIVASDHPKIISALKAEGTSLTGWNKTIADGDVIGFNVDSVTSIQRATLEIEFA